MCFIPASIAFVLPQRQLVRGNPPETPVIRKEEIIMHDIILFMIGAMAGGFVAAAFLCALQINRNEEEEHGEA